MTQLEFLDHTRSAYLNARKHIYTPKHHAQMLVRGTSHSISSVTEDLLGCYCANLVTVNENTKIYIDPPLSFKDTGLKNKSGKRPLLIRPDIAIAKQNIVSCFIDIKTDLGYKRKEFFSQAKERSIQINSIRGLNATCNDGETKIKDDLKISEELQFIYVVISQGNISKNVQEGFIKEIRGLDNVNVFLLSTGDHLNSYHDNPEWKINKLDFDKLDNILHTHLNSPETV